MGPHDPWREHPTMRLTFSAPPPDPQVILNRLAMAMDVACVNMELLEETGDSVDFSFSGMTDSDDVSTSLFNKPQSWWHTALAVNGAVTLSCLQSCPAAVPGPKKGRKHHSKGQATIAVVLVVSVVLVAVGMGLFVKYRVGRGMEGPVCV